jgi:spermidine synthase
MNPIHIQRYGKAVRITGPEGTYSYFHPDHLLTGSSWDAETASLLMLKRPVRSLLLLGLGGGTVARQCRALFPHADIVGVEVSARVLKLAYQHFDLHSLRIMTVNTPAQAFMRMTRKRFDAIIDDIWPPGLESTKPLFVEPNWTALISSRLKPGGMYAVNVYSRKESSYEASTAARYLKSVFKCLREIVYEPGPTTVIVGGNDLDRPKDARAKLKRLAPPFARGLQHIHFRTLHNHP